MAGTLCQVGIDENQDAAQAGQCAQVQYGVARNEEDIGKQRVEVLLFRRWLFHRARSIAAWRGRGQ